jgi:hypothetical protein
VIRISIKFQPFTEISAARLSILHNPNGGGSNPLIGLGVRINGIRRLIGNLYRNGKSGGFGALQATSFGQAQSPANRFVSFSSPVETSVAPATQVRRNGIVGTVEQLDPVGSMGEQVIPAQLPNSDATMRVLRLRDQIQAVLRRGDGELNPVWWRNRKGRLLSY